MRIDLHCHTKATKKGDGEGRNVSRKVFCEKVANADVKILAITNHNCFDKEQYLDLKESVKAFCQVWPGIEIDVQGKTKWHLIVVANPDNLDLFSNQVNNLFIGKNIDKCALSMEEVYRHLNNCDVIYIPHYHKNPGIKEEDRNKLEDLVGDDSRIFLELSNHRSLGIYTNYGYRSIVGSDVKDWNVYDQCDFAELKLPVDSFRQFCLLAKRDKDIVETLLNKKQFLYLTAKPHETVSFSLKIYQDINILFGPKGTGKTEIIKSLYDDMVSHGLSCEKYLASEKQEDFKAITSTDLMPRDLSKVNAQSCENDFATIRNWKETVPTAFEQYLTWYRTKDTSANKRRMRITESTTALYTKPIGYDMHAKDKRAIDNVEDSIQSIKIKEYLEASDAEKLESLLYKLKMAIFNAREEDLIDEYSVILTNKTIDSIKKHADRSTDTVSKPSSTGLMNFVQNRINLLIAVNHIIDTISLPDKVESTLIGELEGKGKIFVTSHYRFLCDASYAKEFDKRIGYRKLKEIILEIKELKTYIFSNELATRVQQLNDHLNELSIVSVEPFLGIEKYISDESGNMYTPSNGEQSIILLERVLKKDADAYFLDEPELGMGNSYIDANIRPLITELAKQHKYVVIATHNANIAVRTLPYMTVFRTHNDGVYSTYCGNPFNDLLINIEDENDIKSWSTESLHTLEGGEEAFYGRKEIYESKNN